MIISSDLCSWCHGSHTPTAKIFLEAFLHSKLKKKKISLVVNVSWGLSGSSVQFFLLVVINLPIVGFVFLI